MKLYKIASKNECGIYRKFYEYPKLREIVTNPEQYTVTECYLDGVGQVCRKRSISTTDYSNLVRKLIGEDEVRICYCERSRRKIVYKGTGICEGVADYLTRPYFIDGIKIDRPTLIAVGHGEVGAEYHVGPGIDTVIRTYEECTLEDVKKFEFSDDNIVMRDLIYLLDLGAPEWRQPRFRDKLVRGWIESRPLLSAKVKLNYKEVCQIPWFIRFDPGDDVIDIGRELLA